MPWVVDKYTGLRARTVT